VAGVSAIPHLPDGVTQALNSITPKGGTTGPPTGEAAPFGWLPAAGAPFVDVRFLLAQSRVVAVAGVEPGVVGEGVEQAGGHVVDQGREVFWGGGLADASGEQSIASAVNRCTTWVIATRETVADE
jgi:hypothetical protein